MTIRIDDLTFECIIGILEHERVHPQRVVVDVEITYDYSDAFINYADVAEHIKEIMRREAFELIEEALNALKHSLKEHFPGIATLNLRITKPDILPDCRVSVAETYKFKEN